MPRCAGGKLAFPALYETSGKGEIAKTLPMTPTITAFERSPDRGKGLAPDMRVRWALEEVGQAYEVRLVSFGAGTSRGTARACRPRPRGSGKLAAVTAPGNMVYILKLDSA